MEKLEDVKIISISAITEGIFGLGDDNKVYRWRRDTHVWELYASSSR